MTRRSPSGVRDRLTGVPGVTDKRMFGGIAFMTDGNMTVGVSGDDLMVRVGKERYEEALTAPERGRSTCPGTP